MKTETLCIDGIPAVLYGEASEKIVLWLHGKYGRKEEALTLSPIFCEAGWQVLAVDLPEHGERANAADEHTAGGAPKKCYPWVVIPEWQAVVQWLRERYSRIIFCAVSMSAWFLMRAFRSERFEHCLMISPIVDMRLLIEDKMKKAGITASDLGWKQSLPDADGEMIVWDFYAYAAYQPISRWETPTEILYARGDTLQPEEIMQKFARRFGCGLTVIDGEHYLPPDTPPVQEWVREQLRNL
ncbi:MAG: alpha/beta hydrolase [Clostridia bacterium]|nr:alpha/beta hydrolase [Clostridia bacterium]MBQ8370027.1 alpha/beta hydrolase [Clostridia bacterium]